MGRFGLGFRFGGGIARVGFPHRESTSPDPRRVLEPELEKQRRRKIEQKETVLTKYALFLLFTSIFDGYPDADADAYSRTQGVLFHKATPISPLPPPPPSARSLSLSSRGLFHGTGTFDSRRT